MLGPFKVVEWVSETSLRIAAIKEGKNVTRESIDLK
jgi:hypothetical protein